MHRKLNELVQQATIPKPKPEAPTSSSSSSSTKSERLHMVEPPDSENVGLNKLKSALLAVLMSQSWPKVFVGCVHSDHLLREERLACKAGKIIGKDSSA
ncbi:hypothetical protein SDJN02_21883, partial [Cucurbita argyrosperma subsp. argyrosperma]